MWGYLGGSDGVVARWGGPSQGWVAAGGSGWLGHTGGCGISWTSHPRTMMMSSLIMFNAIDRGQHGQGWGQVIRLGWRQAHAPVCIKMATVSSSSSLALLSLALDACPLIQ